MTTGETVARGALDRVLALQLDARDDTPLAACGVDAAAWPLLAAAIAMATDGQVRIADAEVPQLTTYGELVALIDARATGRA